MIPILLSLIAGLVGMLVVVLGWIGNKLYDRLGSMSKDVRALEKTLHNRITGIDLRVTYIEARYTPLNGVISRQ